MNYVTHVPPHRGLWVRTARTKKKKHAGIFGILHFTYFGLGRTESFSGILNSLAVGVLECRADE